MSSNLRSSSPITIDEMPREILERIFDLLPLESKLAAGLTCHRWLNILKASFVHLTDILLVFEDGYCQINSVVNIQQPSNGDHGRETAKPNNKRQRTCLMENECGNGLLTVNICACPQHSLVHRHTLRTILMTAGRHVKKVIIEDYLLEKGCFVDAALLEMIAKRCQKLNSIELHHVDFSRTSEERLSEIFKSSHLNELVLDQCQWASWTEAAMNRALKSILLHASNLREIHLTACALLNDRTLHVMAKTCLSLWYIDFTGCRSITARGLAHFFYFMPPRQSDLLYIKICKTRIDGNELQYFLYCGHHPETNGKAPGQIDDGKWAICNFIMETGHRACSFQNRHVPGKSVIVFV